MILENSSLSLFKYFDNIHSKVFTKSYKVPNSDYVSNFIFYPFFLLFTSLSPNKTFDSHFMYISPSEFLHLLCPSILPPDSHMVFVPIWVCSTVILERHFLPNLPKNYLVILYPIALVYTFLNPLPTSNIVLHSLCLNFCLFHWECKFYEGRDLVYSVHYFCLFVMLGSKHRAWCMLGKHSTYLFP